MRLIIAGSRHLAPTLASGMVAAGVRRLCREAGIGVEEIEEVVSGHSGEVDLAGERFAKAFGFELTPFPYPKDADLVKRGLNPADFSIESRGPLRNGWMADYAAAAGPGRGALLAIWADESRGTASMISEAHRCGLRVVVVAVEPMQVLLEDKGRDFAVRHRPAWLERAEADALLGRALASPLPQPETYGGGAQIITTRRKSCAFGPAGLRYRYAGQVRQTQAWPRGFAELAEEVGLAAGAHFNFCLVNVYPDGQAQLGWHADGEPDLVPLATIASLSLGATRDFQMRMGDSGPAELTVPLAHGDLLLMEGHCQRYLQHQVPIRRGVKAPRVNLTFRRVRT